MGTSKPSGKYYLNEFVNAPPHSFESCQVFLLLSNGMRLADSNLSINNRVMPYIIHTTQKICAPESGLALSKGPPKPYDKLF